MILPARLMRLVSHSLRNLHAFVPHVLLCRTCFAPYAIPLHALCPTLSPLSPACLIPCVLLVPISPFLLLCSCSSVNLFLLISYFLPSPLLIIIIVILNLLPLKQI